MARVASFLIRLTTSAAIVPPSLLASGICLEQKKVEAPKPAEAKAPATDIQQFCANNAAIMGDAKIGWQTSRLLVLEEQIRQRLAELEAKKVEYAEWLRKREDAMRQAAESVVAIYARMRPDAAALQIAAMDDAAAAAILAKLSSRNAGAILNEMEAGRAARLTRTMSGPDSAPDRKKS